MTTDQQALGELVRWLADGRQQPWYEACSYNDAANRVLAKMVSLGLIEGKHHPHTLGTYPSVFRVGGQLFGRLDDIDHHMFDNLPDPNQPRNT